MTRDNNSDAAQFDFVANPSNIQPNMWLQIHVTQCKLHYTFMVSAGGKQRQQQNIKESHFKAWSEALDRL